MLSNTCKTAIKAVVYLSSRGFTGKKPGVKEIATHINASEHTVSKILQNLVRQNVINSTKGPLGGFYITEVQRKVPVITIIHKVDGQAALNKCGLGLDECTSEHPCPIHDDYEKGRAIIANIFTTQSIHSLCETLKNGRAHLKN